MPCRVIVFFGAKRRHAKTRQMVTFSYFRMTTFSPAARKNDTFHASPFRFLFVVSLPGGAKGRHTKTAKITIRMTTFRVFAPKTRLYDMAQINHHRRDQLTTEAGVLNSIYVLKQQSPVAPIAEEVVCSPKNSGVELGDTDKLAVGASTLSVHVKVMIVRCEITVSCSV